MKITVTPENIIEYPFHKHETHEIVCYLKGKGIMKTEQGNIPFEEGTILILPPNLGHCSISENGFKNVCVHIYDPLLDSEKVFVGKDTPLKEVQTLATILVRNFTKGLLGQENFLTYLYHAYRELVLHLIDKPMKGVVENLREELVKNLSNVEYNIAHTLEKQELSAVSALRSLGRAAVASLPRANPSGSRKGQTKKGTGHRLVSCSFW